MEFTVSRNRLLVALQHARCAIAKGAVPSFKCFVLTFSDDQKTMTVHASDGSIWISETVLLDAPATVPAGSPAGIRPIAIWYPELLRSVKSLDEQPLRFVVGEYQLTVYHSCGSFRLPLSPSAEEFLGTERPTPDVEAPDGYTLDYEAPGLRSILSHCNFAMARDELRPALNGVFVNFAKDFADYVSSDGHQLVRVRKRPMVGVSELSFIIPRDVVRILLRLLPSTGDVSFDFQKPRYKQQREKNGSTHQELVSKAKARVVIDDVITLQFTPTEGRYPSYWTVIPESSTYQTTIERKPLIKSISRLSIFQDGSGLMKMVCRPGTLSLSTSDFDYATSGEETLPCQSVKTDGTELNPNRDFLTIGVKTSTLAAVLNALPSEKVVIQATDPSRAMLILPTPQTDVEEITMLVMPMLCND